MTAARAASGLLLATDVADYLVAKGVPFRDAHEIVGALVRRLVREGRSFEDLTRRRMAGALAALRCGRPAGGHGRRHRSAKKRTPQSTHPDAVAKALAELQSWLKAIASECSTWSTTPTPSSPERDPQRPLSALGRAHAESLASRAAARGVKPDVDLAQREAARAADRRSRSGARAIRSRSSPRSVDCNRPIRRHGSAIRSCANSER